LRLICLVILDGWGIAPPGPGNAVELADTPVFDALWTRYPHATLRASGEAVGLPAGQMGNSEVGHLNMGAGRVVYQDLTRISKAIADGDFFTNPVLLDCIAKTKAAGGRLHLAGLLSDGGVHSHISHLYGLLELAKQQGLTEVYVHPLLDGRDTPPKSGADYLRQLEEKTQELGVGTVATVIGRYYAMDRDNRWDRVEKAYKAMVCGEGETALSSAEAISASYAAGVNDEFVLPTVITPGGAGAVRDGDGFIFFNFRSDRAREITRALALPQFDGFGRANPPKRAT
jgi:2,3-bisphosphoglycerate-independent phosphoglycerate mutase